MERIQFTEIQKNNFIKNTKKENNKTKTIILIIILASFLLIMPIPCLITLMVFLKSTNAIIPILLVSGFLFVFCLFVFIGILMIFKNKTRKNDFKEEKYIAYTTMCVDKKIERNYGDMKHSAYNYYIYGEINGEIKRFSKTKEDYDRINIGEQFIIIFYKNDNIPRSYLWYEFLT